jgi:hypothetical protein
MERVEKERMAALEASLKAQFDDQQRRAAAKAAADAAAHVERARREATNAAAAALQPKITKAVAEAIQAERTRAYSAKLSLEQKLEGMKRKLQRKSANDIGEPAEIDLHSMLVSAFPEDNVSRVPRGIKGPDVVVEVTHQGNELMTPHPTSVGGIPLISGTSFTKNSL